MSAQVTTNANKLAQTATATDAIRHMGTNVFPVLLDWLLYDDTYIRNLWWRRIPAPLRNRKFVSDVFWYNPKARRANSASWALIALGQDASPAIPELAERLISTTNFTVRTRSMVILREIGTPAVAALTAAAIDPRSHTNNSIFEILWTLHQIGSNASAAAPTLKALLQNAPPLERWAYSNALSTIAPELLTNAPSQ